ncbi:MAG: regulatory protein RecX [Crocinitomicaceae bacterium]|nr:regulatory protein RecX [Crocinitomicaceae bacterium]
MKKSGHTYSFLEAKRKIEAWCAYQERAQSEVEKRLRDYGLDTEDVFALISHLITNNFLNEQRFAEAFTSGKVRIKRWGRRKIYNELIQKQVSKITIQAAFDTIDLEVYENNLFFLAERKYAETKGDSYERKMKTARFLTGKGYEFELIQDVMERICG